MKVGVRSFVLGAMGSPKDWERNAIPGQSRKKEEGGIN